MSVAGALWVGNAALTTRVFSGLIDVTVRGGIVLVLAAAIVHLWPRASAAQRHVVWAVACCSLLLLPVVPLIIPAWRVRILPAVGAPWDRVPLAGQHATFGVPAVAGRPTVPGITSRTASRSPSDTLWLMLMLGGWGSGTLVVLGLLVESQRRMRRLVAEALPLADERMLAVLARASSLTQVASPVRIKLHASTVPMVYGVWRPVVVLPLSACTWDETRLYNVILHELAHIKRQDCLVQTAASLVCALYWFNPLVWLAVRALQAEQEQACDDAVLSAGASPCAYAADLLELTEIFHQSIGAILLPALPFARPSQLQTRVKAIIDRTRRRSVVSRWRALLVWGTGLGVVCPLMVLQPRRAEQSVPAPWKPTDRKAFTVRGTSDVQGQEMARGDCTLGTDVPHVVGIFPHRPCRAVPNPATSFEDSSIHSKPLEKKTMKRIRRAGLLTATATAGLLVGAPRAGHAQTITGGGGVGGGLVSSETGLSSDTTGFGLSANVGCNNDRLCYAKNSPIVHNGIVIIDGVRVYATRTNPQPLDQIDPNRIASIAVHHGPNAVAHYGQDAINGVIVITTVPTTKPY